MKPLTLFALHRGTTRHWVAQRVTAVFLTPLGVWFVAASINLFSSSREEVVRWADNPLSLVLFSVFLIVAYWHAALGAAEILTDYIHNPARRGVVKNLIYFVLGLSLGFGLVGLFLLARG